jgi:hypothetical protein
VVKEIIVEKLNSCLVTEEEWAQMQETKLKMPMAEDPFKEPEEENPDEVVPGVAKEWK